MFWSSHLAESVGLGCEMSGLVVMGFRWIWVVHDGLGISAMRGIITITLQEPFSQSV